MILRVKSAPTNLIADLSLDDGQSFHRALSPPATPITIYFSAALIGGVSDTTTRRTTRIGRAEASDGDR